MLCSFLLCSFTIFLSQIDKPRPVPCLFVRHLIFFLYRQLFFHSDQHLAVIGQVHDHSASCPYGIAADDRIQNCTVRFDRLFHQLAVRQVDKCHDCRLNDRYKLLYHTVSAAPCNTGMKLYIHLCMIFS